MAQDPLYEALGVTPEKPSPTPRGSRPRWIGLGVALALVAAGAALALRHRERSDDPGVAVARIETPPKPVALPPPPPPPASAPEAAPAAPVETVEIQHGVKIIRLAPATSSAPVRVAVLDAAAVKLARAPDPRLVETSRFGTLPRIGPDGARPEEIYARPSEAAVSGIPRLALIVGGMGLNQLQTAQAAQRLVPAVTFAFPPEGPDLAAQVAEARSAGHEIVLQLPDAVAVASDEATLDSMHRAMGAFVGYAGVTLPPPGAGRAAIARDIAGRGLYAVDAAPAASAGPSSGRPADVVIAAGDDEEATAAGLAHLVAVARAKGAALGLVARAGANIPALAAFTQSLGSQGLRIVPASALADPGNGNAAAAK